MTPSKTLAGGLLVLVLASDGAVADDLAPIRLTDMAGDYLCRIEHRAGIERRGARRPEPYIRRGPASFSMHLAAPRGGDRAYLMVETSRLGGGGSVLRVPYVSEDGSDFRAAEDQGFMRVSPITHNQFRFFHAGFDYPEHVSVDLSVRSGICERVG